MSGETASHLTSPLGTCPPLEESKDSRLTPRSHPGGKLTKLPYTCLAQSAACGWRVLCGEKQGHVLPHLRARQPWPTLFCTGQGPPGPEPPPSGEGRLSLPGLLSFNVAPNCPFYHRKRAVGPDPRHDHPFLDPDSSPPDHRGPVAGMQQTRERSSSISFLCWEPGSLGDGGRSSQLSGQIARSEPVADGPSLKTPGHWTGGPFLPRWRPLTAGQPGRPWPGHPQCSLPLPGSPPSSQLQRPSRPGPAEAPWHP